MRQLQAQADDRSRYETAVGLPNTAGLVGHPIHLIDGQWYLEMNNSSRSWPHQIQILETIERGTWKHVPLSDHIVVWDGRQWLTFPMELVQRRRAGLLSDGNLSDYDIDRLKEAKEEWDSEAERLALRQLLAETQAEEAEGDGDG